MKAISLIQPYATLIFLGYDYKHHETRSWSTAHRGQLAIAASISKPKWARDAAENEYIKAALAAHGLSFDTLPRGCVLGTVNVVAMHKITAEFVAGLTPMEIAAGDYTLNGKRCAWQLENRQLFGASVPCKGALSLWTVPAEVQAEFNLLSRNPMPSHNADRPAAQLQARRACLVELPRSFTPDERAELQLIEAELTARKALSIGIDLKAHFVDN